MYHLPNNLSVDYMRFSSTNTPRSWYSDKIDRVYPQLKSCVLAGYKKIVFCGMSAGGYASIMYAELLSEEYKDHDIETISFNPTLLLGKKYFSEISQFAEPIRSSLPPKPLNRLDKRPVDIPDIVSRGSGRVRHEIHFDSLNIFETFQVEKMPKLPNVTLVPHAFGVGHGAGTIKIFNSGVIHDAIRSRLPSLFPSYTVPEPDK